MCPFITFILLLCLTNIKANGNETLCNDFQANFNMESVVGPWYVAAIIPGNTFPNREVSCYKVEFSEADQAGLRWLVNRTLHSRDANLTKAISGTIVRQRYYSEQPFDVWAKSVEGANGCFQQVLSMDTDDNDVHRDQIQNAVMQLHVLTNNESETFLLQLLWGRMVSAVTTVIYRKDRGVTTQDQLKPAFELINELRGPQRLPRICSKYLPEQIVLE